MLHLLFLWIFPLRTDLAFITVLAVSDTTQVIGATIIAVIITLIIGDTGAPPLFSFHCTNYNTSILNCFMHYVKYNALIPGTSVHPHEACHILSFGAGNSSIPTASSHC